MKSKAAIYLVLAAALFLGGFLLKKLLTFIGVILIAVAAYFYLKDKRTKR